MVSEMMETSNSSRSVTKESRSSRFERRAECSRERGREGERERERERGVSAGIPIREIREKEGSQNESLHLHPSNRSSHYQEEVALYHSNLFQSQPLEKFAANVFWGGEGERVRMMLPREAWN